MLAHSCDSELKAHVELVLSCIVKLRTEDVVTQLKTFHCVYEFMEYVTRNSDLGQIFLRVPYDRAALLLELVIEASQSIEPKSCLLAYSTATNITTLLLKKSSHQCNEEAVVGYLTHCQEQLRRLLRTLFSLVVQVRAQHYGSISPGLFGLICLYQADFQELQQSYLATHSNSRHANEAMRVLLNGVSLTSSVDADSRDKNFYQVRLFTSNVQRFIDHVKQAN